MPNPDIDTIIIAAGLFSARPAANTVRSGSLYSTTDTNVIYRSDGATWSTWATVGGGSGGATVMRLTADSPKASDVTLAVESDLSFAIGANEVWAIMGLLNAGGPNFKFDLSVPSGATGVFSDSSFFFTQNAIGTPLGFNIGSPSALIWFSAVVINSTNAGTVGFEWAQNSSNVSTTTLWANTFLVANKK